jgi:hypothetical protein
MSRVDGWHLGEANSLLATSGGLAKVNAFIKSYGLLACLNDTRTALIIVRRYHPTLNCSPDDPAYKSAASVMGLAYFTQGFYSWMYLPSAYTYTAVHIEGDGPTAAVTITTKEHGDTKTNVQELFRTLGNIAVPKPMDQAVLSERFAALRNSYVAPPTPIKITQASITMVGVGKMRRDQFDDWWTARRLIRFFGKTLPVTFAGYNPQDLAHKSWLPKAEQAMQSFLSLGKQDRLHASPRVLKNCHDFIDAVGVADWNSAMAKIVEPSKIWQFVQPRHVMIQAHKRTIYVALHCDCEWEQEHGLLLVYQGGKKLTRVSE